MPDAKPGDRCPMQHGDESACPELVIYGLVTRAPGTQPEERGSETGRTFCPGDVLRYNAERYHCREGTALVRDNGHAVDTYWAMLDSQAHVLTPDELNTAELVFNVNDYDELERYSPASRATWMTYHPRDRGRITSQHGLQEVLFVRKGARPDSATQIENAREAIEAAESEVRIAENRLASHRRVLAELLAGQPEERAA